MWLKELSTLETQYDIYKGCREQLMKGDTINKKNKKKVLKIKK
jgi:hypothetical protein